MSSTRSAGTDSRRQHRSGLRPSVSTCTVSRLPASSTPAALICCSLAGGIGSKTSLPSARVPAIVCSEGRLVMPGRRWAQSEREMWHQKRAHGSSRGDRRPSIADLLGGPQLADGRRLSCRTDILRAMFPFNLILVGTTVGRAGVRLHGLWPAGPMPGRHVFSLARVRWPGA
jgi:hypothetical protein